MLASWQRVDQRALDLRAAGMPGSLQELRVQAYLDLLQERDSRDQLASPVPAASPVEPDKNGGVDDTGGTGPDDPSDGGGPGGRRPGPAPRPDPATGPSLAALVTITIPLTTYQGRSDTPAEAGGYGILDGDDARDLAAAAARHPRTRWCITALNPDGTAAAHACLPGRQLQHLVRARSARCTAPGCGRPAARCDLDHTVPWDPGGRTCECNMALLCKR